MAKPRKKSKRDELTGWLLALSVLLNAVGWIGRIALGILVMAIKTIWWVFLILGFLLGGLMWALSLISGSVDKDINTKSMIEVPGH